jgi:hypothetical protein
MARIASSQKLSRPRVAPALLQRTEHGEKPPSPVAACEILAATNHPGAATVSARQEIVDCTS